MKKAYFISDLHLGANYITDHREHEARVVGFLDTIAGDAGELYLLGDILDYWYEYKTVVPRGHVRFFGALARLADAGVKITWIVGNHDVWLFDYLRKEIGLTVLNGGTEVDVMGHRFFISHGDDVGYQKPLYRFTRVCFHNRVCQWLYASIHPRWTHAIAKGWSSSNRTRRRPELPIEVKRSPAIDHLCDYVRQHEQQSHVEHYVFGHLHVALQEKVEGTDSTMTILGEWIRRDTYAVYDGETLELLKFQ